MSDDVRSLPLKMLASFSLKSRRRLSSYSVFLKAGRYDGLESLVSVGDASHRFQRRQTTIRNGFQVERFNQRRRKKEETISSQWFTQTLSFT